MWCKGYAFLIKNARLLKKTDAVTLSFTEFAPLS